MASRKRRRPTALALILMGVLSVGGVAALTKYVTGTPQASHVRNAGILDPGLTTHDGSAAPTLHVTGSEVQPKKVGTVEVFLPHFKGNELTFSHKSESVPSGEDPKTFAVAQFLTQSNLMPRGGRVLATTVNEDGLASVQLNSKVYGGFGSTDEATVVKGIVETLKQFPEIKDLEFMVDGQRLDTLGSLDLSAPIPVSAKPSARQTPLP